MTAQTKKSSTGKVSKSRWRTALWIGLWLIVLLAIITAWAWQSRYSLIEKQVSKKLAQQAIDADLNIEAIGWGVARVNNIVLSHSRTVFFETDQVQFTYNYNDALKGKFDTVKIIRPKLQVNLDDNGSIIDGWLPPSSGGDGEFDLPAGGTVIEQGRIGWTAPFGSGSALIDADIMSRSKWSVQFKSEDTIFTDERGATRMAYEGVVVSENSEIFTAIGSLSAPQLDFGTGKAENFRVDYNLKFTRKEQLKGLVVSGWVRLDLGHASAQNFTADASKMKLDIFALLDLETYQFRNFAAEWDIEAQDVSLTDKHKRADIGNLVSANKSMSETPIAKYFTPFFSAKADQLLERFSLSGQGDFSFAPDRGYQIRLKTPLHLKAKKQDVVILGVKFVPALEYRNSGHTFSMLADVNWRGARPLKVNNLALRGRSLDGLSISALTHMSAHIKSSDTWNETAGRHAIRLAPFDMDIMYKADASGKRAIDLSTDIVYDGPVPGGAASGLTLGGNIDVLMQDGNLTMGYAPKGGVDIDAFTSDTGWRAENISMDLQKSEPLFRKKGVKRTMGFDLTDIRADIIGPEDNRHLAAQFQSMHIDADISANPRVWAIDIKATKIASDDFPSPGTLITTPEGTLRVLQNVNGDIDFSVSSGRTQIQTDNIRLRNTKVDLQGRPDDFTAVYNAVSVEFLSGGDVPILPLVGTARLQGALLTGEATSYLPQSAHTPLLISFRSVDGRGTAVVKIDSLAFEPRGLQPQYILPVLSGKLADVSGTVSANFNIGFGGGAPITSSGSINLNGLNVGTLVGPFTGVNADLTFSSVFPLKSQGIQTATISGFDPGFPLKDGLIKFELVEGGVRISEAIWPVENIDGPPGNIYISPLEWRFGTAKNRAVIHIENIGLGTMLAGSGKDKLSATGQVHGVLPAIIDGVNVTIDAGVLGVKDGGVIRFKSAGTDAAGAANENAGYAFEALENFQYTQLEALIDGPIDGDMSLKVSFEGNNPDVMEGQLFQFNNVFTGELINIVRNLGGAFSNEENLKRIIEIKNGDENTP